MNQTANRSHGSNTESIHKGHRNRLREKFAKNGGRDLEDHELLELLLYFVIPRANTNDIAHRMMDEFGSLKNVFSATDTQMLEIQGAGEKTKMFIDICREINRRIIDTQTTKKQRFDKLSNVGEFLIAKFAGENHEHFYAMLLDSNMQLIEFASLSTGSVNSAPFDVRALAKRALVKDATRVILAHNHPGGHALPSLDDHKVTMITESALSSLGITLIEHVLISDDKYCPTMLSRSGDSFASQRMKNCPQGFFRSFYEM